MGRERAGTHLVLVGGHAGVGKSEAGRVLAPRLGAALLDKDTLTRPLAEALLRALGSTADDRQSAAYRTIVRPAEYRCLLDTAAEVLGGGGSVVAVAPFVAEFRDAAWLEALGGRCAASGTRLTTVELHCGTVVQHRNIVRRGATRDSWKLAHWAAYVASLGTEPTLAHVVLRSDDPSRLGVELASLAARLAGQGQVQQPGTTRSTGAAVSTQPSET